MSSLYKLTGTDRQAGRLFSESFWYDNLQKNISLNVNFFFLHVNLPSALLMLHLEGRQTIGRGTAPINIKLRE